MFKILKKALICIFIGIVSFLMGYVSSDTYNFYNSNYEIKFIVNEEFDYLKLEDQDYLLTIVDSDEKYSEINVEKMIKKDDVNITKEGNEYTIKTGFQYYEEIFLSKSKTKGARVRQFFKDAINGLVSDDSIVTYSYDNTYIVIDEINEYVIPIVTATIGLGLSVIYVVFSKEKNEIEYDNQNIYRTPFHKTYWKESINFLSDTKNIVTIAMLFALMMVCKLFALPSGFSNLGISFTFLFLTLIALIYGPVAGLSIGFLSDIIGFFLFDKKVMPFYFGYTIQAMLAGFSYGLFFYKSKITFTKCFFSRVIANLVLNVIWGSICFGHVYGYDIETTKVYVLIIALPKNLIYLIPQSIILFMFLKFLNPILYRNKFICKTIYENVSII